MKITMVSKIRLDGTPCPKCEDVKQRLTELGLLNRIDTTEIADERDPDSPGARLAALHNVGLAPFFVVEDGGNIRIYTVFMRFLREVLETKQDADATSTAAQEVLRANPELDLL